MGLHHASPVTANGPVFFLNDDGVLCVVRAGPRYELNARNELGATTYASPAVSGGRIFLRSFTHLCCIGKPAQSRTSSQQETDQIVFLRRLPPFGRRSARLTPFLKWRMIALGKTGMAVPRFLRGDPR